MKMNLFSLVLFSTENNSNDSNCYENNSNDSNLNNSYE